MEARSAPFGTSGDGDQLRFSTGRVTRGRDGANLVDPYHFLSFSEFPRFIYETDKLHHKVRKLSRPMPAPR